MIPAAMISSFSLAQSDLAYPRPAHVPQITAAVRPSDAPWLYSALTQVWNIEQTGTDIPGLGDLRISEDTATRARLLLSMIDLMELPSPQVSPVSGGGMSITWEMGPKEVKYALYPDGEMMFYKVHDDDIDSEGPIETMMPNEVTGPLKWMLDVRP